MSPILSHYGYRFKFVQLYKHNDMYIIDIDNSTIQFNNSIDALNAYEKIVRIDKNIVTIDKLKREKDNLDD